MPRRPRRHPRRPLVVALAVTAALVAGPAGPLALRAPAALAATGDPVTAAGPAAGTFYPLPSTALLGSASAPTDLAAGSTTTLTVTGRDGLPPAGVSAVVVNVTARAAGPDPVLLGLRPTSGALATSAPLTSVTALPGRPRTTLVTVPLDPQGSFAVLASAAAQARVDLVGLYAADDTVVAALGPSGGYQPMSAVRVVGAGAGTVVADDDATGSTGDAGDAVGSGGSGGSGGVPSSPTSAVPSPQPTVDLGLAAALGASERRAVALDLGQGVAPHVTALLVRVTVVGAPAAGTVTVAADAAAGEPTQPGAGVLGPAASAPASPTVTVERAGTATNLAVVPAVVDGDGLLRVVLTGTLARPADVRVDLVGFYDDGGLGPDLRFRSLPVGRVVDTRQGLGASGPLDAATSVDPGVQLVGDDTFALVGTLTTIGRGPAGDGATDRLAQVSVGPTGDAAGVAAGGSATRPGAVPVPPGTQQSTPVQPELGTDGRLALVVPSSTSGTATGTATGAATGAATGSGPTSVQAVLDVVGSFEAFPQVQDPSARGWVDAVPGWQVRALVR